jgi:hypothetical protein
METNCKCSFSPPLPLPFSSLLSLPPSILIPSESNTPPLGKICAIAWAYIWQMAHVAGCSRVALQLLP